MVKTKKQKTFRQLAYKPLLSTALAFAGVFNMMSVVLAEGTAAGTGISNTATATYSDGTTDFEAISNTVVINVAEVAGLTVTSSGFNDPNGGSIVNGDTLTFDFTVSNTGNAPTYVFVPGADNIASPNGDITSVDIINPVDGSVLGNVPAAGGSTEDILAAAANAGIIPADGSFVVRVTLEVTGTRVGDDVTVQFGDTNEGVGNPGDPDKNQDNVTYDGTPDFDVRTLNYDNSVATGVPDNGPVNGEREAADSRTVLYATSVTDQLAQARLTKTSNYSDFGTSTTATDDLITYALRLEVANDTTNPNVDPGSLEGTNIRVNRGAGVATESRILVSDAVPVGTVFNGAVTTPGPNWEVVYSLDDPTVSGNNPLQAAWTTTQPTNVTAIKRVGFIYNATANGALAPATVVSGFGFRVITSNVVVTANAAAVANIAQIFGETENEPGNNIVFDESGDQNTNNYDDGVVPNGVATTFDPIADDGVGDPDDPETTPNANDGTGDNGESNVVTITTVDIPPSIGDLLNGPNGAAPAVGPSSNNDDFTNVAVAVAPAEVNLQGQPITTAPGLATIVNTVAVPSTTANQLDTITLLPLSPSQAAEAADLIDDGLANTSSSEDYGTNADLPDNTIVTITYAGQSVEYTYTGGDFIPTGGATPVVIGTIAPGDDESYTVTVQLPATDTTQVTDYNIPIAAFVDNDNNGAFTPTSEQIANITIDRVYTGFMKLDKAVSVNGGAFEATPSGEVNPGDDLTYQITYTNISETAPAGGGGNILLNANDFTIVEDGNAATNNWASTTLHQRVTTVEPGTTVEYFNGGTSLGNNDPADETAGPSQVTVYENQVGTVAPGVTGAMEFTRQVQ